MWSSEWATTVAVSVIAFRRGGAGAVALVAVVRMAPAAFLTPVAATVADRIRRDHVLVAVGVIRAAALGGAGAMFAAGLPSAPLYGLVVVATVAQTLYRPAHSALLPALCRSPEELTSANVVRGALDSTATLAGPLVAAGLLALSGPAAALAGCAVLSAAGAMLVAGLRYESRVWARRRGFDAFEAVAGIRVIATDRAMRLLTGLTTLQTFLRGCVSVLVVVVAIDLLHRGEPTVGVLNAAIGVGALIGSLVAAALSWNGRLARCFGVGVALWGLPLVILGIVPGVAAALALLGVIGVGNALVDVGVFTLLARLASDEVMARAFAAFEATLTLGVAPGAAVTAPALDAFGVRGALVVLGLTGPAGAIAAWRRLRRLDRRMVTRDDDIDMLRAVPLLGALPQVMIETLASGMDRAGFPPGATVFREGEPGDRFYVIAGGVAEVSRSGSVVAELRPGDCFGEIALLRADLPRTATVRAIGDVPLELCALGRGPFLEAMTGYPSSGAMADTLARDRLADPPASKRLQP